MRCSRSGGVGLFAGGGGQGVELVVFEVAVVEIVHAAGAMVAQYECQGHLNVGSGTAPAISETEMLDRLHFSL